MHNAQDDKFAVHEIMKCCEIVDGDDDDDDGDACSVLLWKWLALFIACDRLAISGAAPRTVPTKSPLQSIKMMMEKNRQTSQRSRLS